MVTKKYFHIFDRQIIREYDVRGIVGHSFFAQDAFYFGKAIATYLRRNYENNFIVVGYDGRNSSPLFASALISGLTSCGMQVANIGLCPTPMLYYSTYRLEAVGGIMITGSHNPPEYNGLKIMVDQASFYGEKLKQIAKMMNEGDFVDQPGEEITKLPVDVLGDYVETLASNLTSKEKRFKIVWDPGNGSSAPVIRELVKFLPGEHLVLNDNVDGNFPSHHPDPTVPENLSQLVSAVVNRKYDFGLAFDGDGDRLGVVDKFGRIIWGDQLLILFSRDLVKYNQDVTVVADVKASSLLFQELQSLGANAIMWKTGHSLIKAKMVETGALLAGEMSGHLFFADRYYGFDDAVYAAVRLIDLLARTPKSLEKIYDELPKLYNTPEMRISCPEYRKFEIIEEVRHRLKVSGYAFSDIDGVRVDTEDGWWLLRASNTEPSLVARCESTTEEGLRRLKVLLQVELGSSQIVCQL